MLFNPCVNNLLTSYLFLFSLQSNTFPQGIVSRLILSTIFVNDILPIYKLPMTPNSIQSKHQILRPGM